MKTNKGILHFSKNTPPSLKTPKWATEGATFLEEHFKEMFPLIPEDEEIVTHDGIHFWTIKKANRREGDGLYGESNLPKKIGT